MTDNKTTEPVFPVRPRDWVMCGSEVAQVKAVHEVGGELLADLVIYSRSGERVGRESPAMGGPRTFEPMCSLDGWERCQEPAFPMRLQWVDHPDGSRVAMFWSDRLPPANYRKPKRAARRFSPIRDDKLRMALEQIAKGHNDPKTLANEVLGRRKV